jgi:hypothetical protein
MHHIVRGDGGREFYRLTCPDRADVNGLYQKVHDEHYQRAGSDYCVIRNAEGEWCVTDGTQYLLNLIDTAAEPTDVRAWRYRSTTDGKMKPCTSGVTLYKPIVQNAGCDECKAYPIVGEAYYCTVRHDYDLCSDCEGRSVQPYPTVKYYVNHQRPHTFVYRCHIAEDLSSVPTFNFTPDATHVDVTCTHCKASPIVGPRYKCTARPDYDLCAACEATTATDGAQPHAMIKIYDPRHHPAHIEYMDRTRTETFIHNCAFLEHMYHPELLDENCGEDCYLDPVYVVTPPAVEPTEQHQRLNFGTSSAYTTTAGTSRGATLSFGAESFVVTCPNWPALDGVYTLECEGQYQCQGNRANTLIRHPVEGVWCISDGNRFLVMATDTATLPSTVTEWKCLQVGKGWVKCPSMTVVKY